MNMVSCGEHNCRYQVDGYCTRSDLAVNSAVSGKVYSDVSASTGTKCCYFEQR